MDPMNRWACQKIYRCPTSRTNSTQSVPSVTHLTTTNDNRTLALHGSIVATALHHGHPPSWIHKHLGCFSATRGERNKYRCSAAVLLRPADLLWQACVEEPTRLCGDSLRCVNRPHGSIVADIFLVTQTHIYDSNELYDMLDSWSSERLTGKARSLLASVDNKQGSLGPSPGSACTDKKPLRLSPWKEALPFFYKGHLLRFHCTQTDSGYFPRKTMTLSCLGRSSKTLEDLLQECRLDYLKKSRDRTVIFEHRDGFWKKLNARDIRPIHTVVMKEEVKKALLDDIQSYLDPETQAWYASRGLPYRRGYLLFGRPGTGKSSLSLSIAGCFGLEVYIVNIASIDDSRLSTMFTSLPPRCVVLLEDIDAVGVSRSYDSDGEGSDTSSGAPLPGKKSQGRVSLSGLLNALDGVGSTDGRVLIMTTNHIEHLDPAVIRPGRVDMKVEFQLADHEITRQLFRNMFEQGDLEEPNEANRVQNNVATAKLAEEFAGQIPSLEFSSADIISFLLKHRKSASKAVRNVSGWVSDERKRRLGDSWMLKDARSD